MLLSSTKHPIRASSGSSSYRFVKPEIYFFMYAVYMPKSSNQKRSTKLASVTWKTKFLCCFNIRVPSTETILEEIKPNFSNLYSFNSAPFLIKSRYCFSTLCQMGKVFCISLDGCKARKVAKASRIC